MTEKNEKWVVLEDYGHATWAVGAAKRQSDALDWAQHLRQQGRKAWVDQIEEQPGRAERAETCTA